MHDAAGRTTIEHVDGTIEQRVVEAAFRRLRSELAEVGAETTVRAWLFAALGAWGPAVPSTREELTQFVRGPLRRVLARNVDRQELPFLLVQLENAIAVVDSEDSLPPSPRPSHRPPLPASASATWTLAPIVPGRIRLLVVSGHRHLGDTLRLTLGPDSFVVDSLADVGSSTDMSQVDIILIDAMQPPTIEPLQLVAGLGIIPKGTLVTIWASEEDYGQAVVQALSATGIPSVPLVSSEGVAPFLDLARSRMG
ncbi:MAG: hypothetical protein AAGF12_15070 [Myxococcota bacterium]